MPDEEDRKPITGLVTFPAAALQRPSSGLVHRGVQAANRLLNVDTVPIPLGVEARDGLVIIVFKKGTVIPCERQVEVALDREADGHFGLNVFQGFSDHVGDNVLFCELRIQNESVPAHWVALVKLVIDVKGCLNFTVVDSRSNKSCEVTVRNCSGGLTINEMKELEEKWKKKQQKAG